MGFQYAHYDIVKDGLFILWDYLMCYMSLLEEEKIDNCKLLKTKMLRYLPMLL